MDGKVNEEHAQYVLGKVISCMKEKGYRELRVTFMDGVVQDVFVTDHTRPGGFKKKPLTNKH